jgi:DNA-binding winged helix-turn-helix (wHTH) protein
VVRENDQVRTRRAARFGIYEIDLDAGELRKRGIKITLQEQPFRVLALLITYPGQLLTREELQRQIWLEDTLVDADLGLNTAIKKIRTALGDSADNPKFIETLPRRGYRFIAPVQAIQRDDISAPQVVPESLSEPAREQVETQNPAKPGLMDQQCTPMEPEQDPGLVRPAMTAPASPYSKYSPYWVAALILAVGAVFLGREIETKQMHPVFGRIRSNSSAFVFRTVNGPDGSKGAGIGGYDLKSPGDQALAFDYDHSGKQDHLVLYRPGAGNIWIVANTGGSFAPVYAGYGIGGCDLKSVRDRVFAFDYDHSGKLDYLVIYQAETGRFWIVKNNGRGIFVPVYANLDGDSIAGNGARAQQFATGQAFAFDYDHSGKLDYLAILQPGTETLSILKNASGAFTSVYTSIIPGIGSGAHDQSAASQAFAFDYDHSGKLDHLVLYWPGTGTLSILKNSGGTFIPVYQGSGIGGYDLKSPNDRAFAFDYDHSGKLDHLFLYRAGTGLLSILKNSGGTFAPVYEGGGVGGYDLKSPRDQAFAYDYDRSGKLDHLVLYRPGMGVATITYFPRQQ